MAQKPIISGSQEQQVETTNLTTAEALQLEILQRQQKIQRKQMSAEGLMHLVVEELTEQDLLDQQMRERGLL